MRKQPSRVQRQGQIYRFALAGTEYTAFVWQNRTGFQGRIQEHPQVPEQTARTALGVRDALQQWLISSNVST